MPYSDFMPELHSQLPLDLDREAWTELFADGFTTKSPAVDDMEAAEVAVCESGSAFGARLAELRETHDSWPFMAGNLDCAAWLRILSSDPDPAAANVYFTVSRGFQILSPEAAAAFPRTATANYASATRDHPEAVDAELKRLQSAGFIDDWSVIAEELGLPPGTDPTVVLAIGVVVRKGKVRIVIDGSAPRGASLNDAIEPAPTVLPNIVMAMAAMTQQGYGWKSDFTDSFLQISLQQSSLPLCVVEWRGRLYGYRRLGFGFKSGPTVQQSTTVCVIRALTRRLVAGGLGVATPPSVNHHYPHISAQQGNRVNALLAFLDDVGAFNGTLGAAWYSFAHYLLLCHELGLVVSFKEGKTMCPDALLHYLGFDCDFRAMTISLHAERVAALRAMLDEVCAADFITVGTALSLVGTLVFCSAVIRIGRVHYRAIIDAVSELGPNPAPFRRIRVTNAMRAGLEMWQRMLSLINARSACAPVRRISVPGECSTDASFGGWGWQGMGVFDFAAWPADWRERIGRQVEGSPLERIWICELELWALCFLCRRLCPRCRHCRLHVRVDSQPVCSMIHSLSTRSKACLPILTEIAWILASWDVELEVEWIDTKSNLVADVLSRRFAHDHDPAEFATVVRHFTATEAANEEWQHWPAQPPARPELFAHCPVAHPADFSDAWADLDEEEMATILPHYLQLVAD